MNSQSLRQSTVLDLDLASTVKTKVDHSQSIFGRRFIHSPVHQTPRRPTFFSGIPTVGSSYYKIRLGSYWYC